ncbi:MAG: HAD family phosphatase [Nanoarchaeota archaeon]
MIKTIIFDLGGVYFTNGSKMAVDEIAKSFSVPKELVDSVIHGKIGTLYREGKITEKEFWQKGQSVWGLSKDSQLLSKIWLKQYKPNSGTVKLIKKLNHNGYELLYLSDNVQERVDYLENKYPFQKNFKDGVFSHKAKVRKPNPQIYRLVLQKTKSKPREIVFIDDKENFLFPAKKLGINIILFDNPEQLRRDLKILGVKI